MKAALLEICRTRGIIHCLFAEIGLVKEYASFTCAGCSLASARMADRELALLLVFLSLDRPREIQELRAIIGPFCLLRR